MLLNHLSKQTVAFAVLAVAVIFSACDIRPTSMGYQHRIFVVADSLLWSDLKDEIIATFEEEIRTPHTERSFYIEQIPLDKLNEFKTRMNIFFVGTMADNDAVSEYLKKILPDNFKQGVDEDRFFYIFNDDLFARGQVGLIMFARNLEKFHRHFAEMKMDIYDQFKKKYYARLKAGMFEKDEQTRLAETLMKNFGWKVRVQHDYTIAAQDIPRKYVWLRRFDPDRWVSIWQVPGDSSLLDMNNLVRLRNDMTRLYYGGDVVVDDETTLDTTDFRGQETRKLVGTWKNDSLMIGGPFRMYAVKDAAQDSLYLVDIAVMAPGKMKKPYLDQLEVIASTFQLAD